MSEALSETISGSTRSDGLRMMAVHAHPDDESSKGGATMARYVDEGAEVLVVTCTGGERGSILNPGLKDRPDIEANMTQVRRGEMERARAILGVQHAWLGFEDSGLPEGDPLPPLPPGCFALAPIEAASLALVKLIREFRPHVITTYDENGGYPHPDHIMTHKVTMAAYDDAADPSFHPEAGEPWRALKLYYDVGFNRDRFEALDAAMVRRGLEAPFAEWRKNWKERADKRPRLPNITTRIVCADWFERRDQALIAHATQVDPEGGFFRIPLDIQREAWPTEDFELVHSELESELPEDDLFAGVRTTVCV